MIKNGMKTFTIIWFGQLVSLIGTSMTRFALLVWLFEETNRATDVALLGFFSFVPFVLVSPIAGVWVDRLDRRKIMALADLGAGIMTIALLILYSSGRLQTWHLFMAEAFTGAFEAFQIPAYIASTTLLIPKKQYGRAGGMRSLASSASQITGPILGGALLGFVGLKGVMSLDILTFLVAMATLLIVKIPRPIAKEDDKEQKNTWQEIRLGLQYIWQRPGLRGLLAIYSGINFFAALTYFAILPTLVLTRNNGDELALATVQVALGLGGVVGSIVLSVWGGPRRQIHAVLAGAAVSFWCGDLLFAIGRSVPVLAFAAFSAAFFVPFIIAGQRAIWQVKVPPALQGRVFSVQSMIQTGTMPLGYLIAGPLADRIMEPAMAPGGILSPWFSWLVGSQPGAGMGVMFLGTAICGTTISIAGYLFRPIRNVESDLPDHDEAVEQLALS
ncbi:MAG: MFS transporter [Candidatus Promineifilaceae bacterium]